MVIGELLILVVSVIVTVRAVVVTGSNSNVFHVYINNANEVEEHKPQAGVAAHFFAAGF